MQAILSIIIKRMKIAIRTALPLSVAAITKKNLPFFIMWNVSYILLDIYFLPIGVFKIDVIPDHNGIDNIYLYMYIWLFVGLMTSVLHGRRLVQKTLYSIITILICYFLLGFLEKNILSYGMIMLMAACMGHIYASNVYVFFMVLNNSEKFYSMILAILLPKVIMLIQPILVQMYSKNTTDNIIFLVTIVIMAVCSYYYKYIIQEMPSDPKVKVPLRAYAVMPLVFVVFVIDDMIVPASLNYLEDLSKSQIEYYYFLGILLGVFFILVLQRRFAVNIYIMLNISFALLAMGFVGNIINFQIGDAGLLSSVCFGCSYSIGFVNIYYLGGLMTKKFQSLIFYRVGITLSATYYFFAFFALDEFKKSEMGSASILMNFICICIVILYFALSPFFIKMLCHGDWSDDAYRSDVTKCSRLEAKLKDYKLTPSELEVCKLLLDGYTIRQIAGITSKAYATINTYCTSIYRKLKISSRIQLLVFLQDYI